MPLAGRRYNGQTMGGYDAVLLEDMNHKFDVILEYLAPLSPLPAKVDTIDERLKNIETDVQIIRAAVTDRSAPLLNHEQRLTTLESKTA